ncbi:tRNA(Met) cytidine acetyltransferase TmcA [Halorussus halophilus]|uniref:tRNA(Met) cytidine acetyltransferase TmcA n=1 Tax=Halorussus halophilus TaxID=2650975 RepID=UPI0013010BC9|nr:tRNA(Met) cytidine acetyltransferase TmcA [Halorussus halophilus]
MPLPDVATELHTESQAVGERRLLVLTGTQDACYEAAETALDAAEIPRKETTLLARERHLDCERVGPKKAKELLGTTQQCIVLDLHDDFRPNAIGRTVGAVDGGGLYVLLMPNFGEFADQRTDFDSSLAVPPADIDAVSGNFRRRFCETLQMHRGVAIWNTDTETLEQSGLTHPKPRFPTEPPELPDSHTFPREAYDACLTGDQIAVVQKFEVLRGGPEKNAVVVEADRGRGKSSAAGIAAGSLAAEGEDVLVTAPEYRSAREVFVRAADLLRKLGHDISTDHDPPREIATDSGKIRFAKPTEAAELPDAPDVLFVDEAAALSVGLLERFLAADRVAFTTTVHGYEGAGRGFSVRFRDRLAESDHEVTETRLDQPIRYAAGDPVEVWAFRALLLDARPPVEQVVRDANPESDSVEYRTLSPGDLLADENLLREAFGLLVLAHYRTEPADLARLLDAPNLSVRALTFDGHVVGVALLAREGNLPEDVREHMYDGGRVKGNMLPDVLTTQLRDESAGIPKGMRVVRIAVHDAVRSAGLGSRLLAEIRAEFEDELDWLGVGYGATPQLLRFWHRNGYRTVQLSTTRNDTSGEHSALMLDPLSGGGRALHDRHADWFASRITSMLGDSLRGVDADVVRALLPTIDARIELDLSPWDWRAVAASAYGPGLYDAAPRPFRRVALKYFVEKSEANAERSPDAVASRSPASDSLTLQHERVLVRKVLQGHDWKTVADELGFHSTGQCMRALGDAYEPLVDAYGDEAAMAEKERYE